MGPQLFHTLINTEQVLVHRLFIVVLIMIYSFKLFVVKLFVFHFLI